MSIGRLFLAGILPGALLTLVLLAVSGLVARRRGYGAELDRYPTFRELWASFLESVWALMFPVILIIGFRFGFFTATEAGAFLVFYALAVGLLVYRELNFEKLVEALQGTMSDLGMVMLLIMMAAVLGYAVTLERAPQEITAFLTELTTSPAVILLLVMALLVVTGMFLEGAANILLITPVVLPVLVAAGYDPVHMGILIVTIINFGGVTPPVGVIMFTVCGITDCKAGAFSRAALPFYAAMILFFAVLASVPGLALFLPRHLM